MIALSSHTAAAIALHAAEGSWVMFVQLVGVAGPVKIEPVLGRQLASRITQLVLDNPYELQLIGLLPSSDPDSDASEIANEFIAYQIHDGWFEPNGDLLAFIGEQAQSSISVLLAQTHPGGLSDAPVDIEQIASILDVSVPTVRRMVKAGEIPYLKFGRFYRFVPNDVLASLRR